MTQVGVKAGLSLTCRIMGEMGTVSLPLQPDKLDGQCLSFPVPGPSSTWVRTNPGTPFRISAVRWHVTAKRQAEMALGYKRPGLGEVGGWGSVKVKQDLSQRVLGGQVRKASLKQKARPEDGGPTSLGRGGTRGARGAEAWGRGGVWTLSPRDQLPVGPACCCHPLPHGPVLPSHPGDRGRAVTHPFRASFPASDGKARFSDLYGAVEGRHLQTKQEVFSSEVILCSPSPPLQGMEPVQETPNAVDINESIS